MPQKSEYQAIKYPTISDSEGWLVVKTTNRGKGTKTKTIIDDKICEFYGEYELCERRANKLAELFNKEIMK